MDLLRYIYVFIRRKYRISFKKFIVKKEKKLLKNTKFVIIADNCWGGAVYQWYEKPYNSPFIGIGIYGECYLKLLSNFDYYMSQDLIFKSQTETKHLYIFKKSYYPMALLDDVEIHFTHYKSEEEVKAKWNRRKERMLNEKNKDNYFFKICDTQRADENIFKKFHQLPFKNKISFTLLKKKKFQHSNHIGIHEHRKGDKNRVPNGVKLFKISFLYFDVTNWLLNKTIKRTTFKS